jgi:enoyl-CoA hydratase/carnithine racemase
MGKKNAERMLGKEGWAPTAAEAKEAGFVMEVVKHDQLMPRAQQIAEQWVKEGKVRSLVAKGQVSR